MIRRDKRSLWQARIDPADVTQHKLNKIQNIENKYYDEFNKTTKTSSKDSFWNNEYINK